MSGKTQCSATCLTFRAPVPSNSFSFSFSLLPFSLLPLCLTLPICAFHLSILSEIWFLNFLWLSCSPTRRHTDLCFAQGMCWMSHQKVQESTWSLSFGPWAVQSIRLGMQHFVQPHICVSRGMGGPLQKNAPKQKEYCRTRRCGSFSQRWSHLSFKRIALTVPSVDSCVVHALKGWVQEISTVMFYSGFFCFTL